MKKFAAMALAGAAMTVAAGTANAAITLTATSVTAAYSNAPTADLHKTSAPTTTVNNVRVTPQILKGTLSSNPGVPVEFFAYCVDIFQSAGATTFEIVSLQDYMGSNVAKAQQLAALMIAEGSKTDKLHDAAVQLAVWEVMNETRSDLDIDKFTETNLVPYWQHGQLKYKSVTTTPAQFWADDVSNGAGILSVADQFLDAAAVNAGGPAPEGYSFHVAKSSTKQDFLFWTYTPPAVTTPVPEPTSWAMMILGMGAVGHNMRRSRRKVALRFA